MNLITAVDLSRTVGRSEDQPYYILADLKRFQALTTGYSVILGREALVTSPSGQPLKNRRDLILSCSPSFALGGAEMFQSLEALRVAVPTDSLITGGENVCAALLDWRDATYIAKIDRA